MYIKRRLLSNAFNILKTWKSSKYVVTTATWHAIMANLCPSRSRTQTQLLLSVLDDDGDGNIGAKLLHFSFEGFIPLTAGAAYIRVFIFLLGHKVPPFKHVKDKM